MPLQAAVASNMPARVRERLEKSNQLRKLTLSGDNRAQRTREANTRRDEILAKKAQRAIDILEKNFDPANIRREEYQCPYQKLDEK